MIEIRHTDYSSINAGELEFSGRAVNTIYIYDNSLWVCSAPVNNKEAYESQISFDLTKEFIQEMKALVMFMENTFEEIDDDSRD